MGLKFKKKRRRRRPTSLNLREDLNERLEREADKNGKSKSDVANEYLEDVLLGRS